MSSSWPEKPSGNLKPGIQYGYNELCSGLAREKMLTISSRVTIPENEIEMKAILAQGSGGQNVNKVATAIHLRFDINASSLPEFHKERLLAMDDSRITRDGVVVIKSQNHRSQERNREEALERLRELILQATAIQKARKPTRPSKSAKRKRVDTKKKRGEKKKLRGKVL